jgi:hypothetical protein
LRSSFQQVSLRLRHAEWSRIFCWLALALVLAAAWQIRVVAIDRSLPYPQHVDEIFIADKAANMLRTGDFNPHYFIYPSLPTYLAAAAMTWGFLDAANHLELKSTDEIGPVTYPYVEHPRVVRPARLVFAFFSVFGLAILAFIARRLGGGPGDGGLGGLAAMVLAPAWLGLSWLYFELSATYLNVNAIGCTLAWAALWLATGRLEDEGWRTKALYPGILAGMTIACKYNFGVLLPALLLAIFWHGGERRLAKAFALLATAGATFLLCSPYTLLDFSGFLDGLGKVVYMYNTKFFDRPESQTFCGHLWLNLKDVQADLGAGGTFFVLAGAVWLARREPRRAAILAIFPLLLLLQMSNLRSHFLRNLLPLLPLWTLFGALGLVATAKALAALAARRPSLALLGPPQRALAALALLLAVAASFLPLGAPAKWLEMPVRSRQDATAWLLGGVLKEGGRTKTVIAAEELALHPGPFREAGVELRKLRMRSLGVEAFLAELEKSPDALVLLPRFVVAHWDLQAEHEFGKLLPGLASLHDQLEPLKEFGSQQVSVCFDSPLHGDPLFVVGRPRRAAARLAAIDARKMPP